MQSSAQFRRDLENTTVKPTDIESISTLWGKIHDRTQQQLSFLLEGYFRASDDLFHDLSSRASSSQEEQQHFNVMRELRLGKSGANLKFQQAVTENYRCILKGKLPLEELDTSSGPMLVSGGERLEIDLACKDMINRSRQDNAQLCQNLTLKIAQLLGINGEQCNLNPLDPALICNAYLQSCIDPLSVGVKSKIILLKQFERHLLNQVQPIYQQLDHLLYRAGYTAHIKTEQPRVEVPTATPLQPQPTPSPQLHELQALCNDAKNHPVQPKGRYVDHSHNPGPVLATKQLSQLLQELDPSSMLDPESHTTPRNLIQPIVERVLTEHHPHGPHALSSNDDDIINLVAMFFDFVLDDENIALPIRFQISRLQLVLLKHALRDEQFFNNAEHPARRFINALAHLGISYNAEDYKSDPFYKRLQAIIERINHYSNADNSIFQRAQTTLNKLVALEAKQAALIEQAARQAEQAQASTEAARQTVQQTLVERLEHRLVAKDIKNFLLTFWQQALIHIHQNQGPQSLSWQTCVQVVDDLVWVCAPHSDSRSRQRLEKLKRDLILRLSSGLSLAYPQRTDYQPALQTILGTLVKAEQGLLQEVEMEELSRHQLEYQLSGNQGSNAIELQQDDQRAVTLEYIEKSEKIPVGSWLSYCSPQTGKPVRCKLFSKRVVDGVYVFTDRYGRTLFEKTPSAFAYDLQSDHVAVIDNRPLFERTLGKISQSLRADQPAK